MMLSITMAAAASFAVPESVHNSGLAYKSCLVDKSLQLEPSGAPVDDVFLAAKTECAAEEFDYYTKLVQYLRGNNSNLSGKAPEVVAFEIIGDQNEANKSRMRLDILKIRAAKNRR